MNELSAHEISVISGGDCMANWGTGGAALGGAVGAAAGFFGGFGFGAGPGFLGGSSLNSCS